MDAKRSEELKEMGNECMKKENFMEAIIHYTHAIKMAPINHLLYSNRSLAFLKVQQFYLAMEDAKETIKLQPNWPKGYFRKGEVEAGAGQYSDAILSYNKAMVLDSTDMKVREAITKARSTMNRERKAHERMPWKYAAGGVGVGLLIVLADTFLTKTPALNYTVLQIAMILVVGAIGYGIAIVHRFLLGTRKGALLEPPVDILGEMDGGTSSQQAEPEAEEATETSKRRKGGTGAARQRYKQGKS